MRAALAGLFMLLAVVLPAIALGSSWAWSTATDTDRFMDRTSALATDRVVQSAVAARLTDAVGAAAPGQAPSAELGGVAEGLTASAAYRAAWRRAQRQVHEALAARVTGASRAPLTFDLDRLVPILRERAAANGIVLPAGATGVEPVVIADAAQVRDVRRAGQAVQTGRLVALLVAVLALLGVLLTAPGLGRGLLRAGVCLVLAMGLVMAGWAVGNAAAGGGVAGSAYDVVTQSLWLWAGLGAAAGVVLAVAGLVLRR